MHSDGGVQAQGESTKARASGRAGLPMGMKHVTLEPAHDVKIGTKDLVSEHNTEC
jgi:hypothetical protein